MRAANAKAHTTEVAVIGAGYCGLSAAIVLASRGLSVQVYEQGEWGDNPSTYNFGSVAAMPPALAVGASSREDDLALRMQSVLQSVQYLKQQVDEFEYDCQWRQPGHITLAMDDDVAQALKQRCAEANAMFGQGVHWLDEQQVRSETGAQTVVAGLLNDHFALIDPAGLLGAMRQHAEALGVQIHFSNTVRALHPQGDSVDLQLESGRVSATCALVASEAAWGLMPDIQQEPLVFYQTHLMLSGVLSVREQALISRASRVYGTATTDKDYFRVHEGRLLFGSRLGLVHRHASPQAIVEALQTRLAVYFPSLSGLSMATVRSGNLGFTADGFPRVGRAGPVLWSGGYCGSGIASAVACGWRLAQLTLSDQTPTSPISHTDEVFKAQRVH